MIADGVANGFTADLSATIKSELQSLYQQASTAASAATTLAQSAFGGYAKGTNYAAPGLHLVGEQGPELIDTRQGSRILNASDTARAFNTTNNNGNVYNFNSPRALSPFEMRRAMRQQDRKMAFEGVRR